jgi:hypothetical protein
MHDRASAQPGRLRGWARAHHHDPCAVVRHAELISWIAGAVPVCTEYGVCSPIPECRVAIVAGLSARFEHGEVRLGVAAVERAFDQRRNLRSRAGLAFLAAAVKLRLDGAMNAVQLRDPVFDRFAIVVVVRHLSQAQPRSFRLSRCARGCSRCSGS